MRYSITKATTQQVEAIGGLDIKEAKTLKLIFAELTVEQVDQLKTQGCVVVPVAKVTTGEVPSLSVPTEIPAEPLYPAAFIPEVSTFDAWKNRYDPPLLGQGMVCALIDTGIRETHQAIYPHVVYSENFTAAEMRDGFDHGTACASLLLAQAPERSILNLKVLDDNGEGTTEEVILAIEKCLELWDEGSQLAPKILNLSLGTEDTGNPDDPLRAACREALDRGMYVNAACGNSGPDPSTITSPACERYVFATGSADLVPMNSNKYGFRVSEFSSRGPTKEGIIKPDAIFFGRDLECASSVSDTALIAKSGTSFAAPFTTGIAILYMEMVARQLPNWRELQAVNFPHIPPEELPTEDVLLPLSSLIDDYLKYLCIRPAGASTAKTNDYGEGLPFGDEIAKVSGVGAGIGAPMELFEVMMPIMILGMSMSMLTKAICEKKK